MKTKVVIFGICALLSACGVGKRGGNLGEMVKNRATGTVPLKNQKASNYQKIQSFQADTQYLVLGSTEINSVPEEISSLPSESEIGTLTVEFEDEIYSAQYDGEVKPVYKKRQQQIKPTVFIIKDSSNPGQIYFVLKNNELAKEMMVKEMPITVRSAPTEYCYKVHFFIKQLVDKVAVLDQDAYCNAAGICAISVRVDTPSPHDVPGTYNLHERPIRVGHSCLETQIYYAVEEVKVNRSIPKVATILVSESISKEGLKLTLNL